MSTEHEREAIGRVEQKLDNLASSLADVRERMAKLEALASHSAFGEMRAEMLRLWEKITQLEAENNRRVGATTATKTWGEWLHRLAPWAFAVGLVVWNYFRPPIG